MSSWSKTTSFHSSGFVPSSRSDGGASRFRSSNTQGGAWERKGHPISSVRRGGGNSGGSSNTTRVNPSSGALRSASTVTGSNKLASVTRISGKGEGGLTPPTDMPKSTQQVPKPLQPGSDTYVMACRDRFIGIAKSLVGEYVKLTMRCGAVHEGVLHTCTPFRNEPFSILLKHVKSKKCPNSAVEVEAALQINASDMVELHAPHFPNVLQAVPHPSGFATDSDISGILPGTTRKLQHLDNAWMAPLPTVSGSGQIGGLGSSTHGKKWDQFEANEKLYGVKASFDENLYTTQLNKTSLTWTQQCRAERMAREIESKVSHNPHVREERNQTYDKDLDGTSEEMRYSGVQRSSTRLLGSPRDNNNSSSARENHGSPSIRYGLTSPSKHDNPSSPSSRTSSHGRSSAPPHEVYVGTSTRSVHSSPVSPRGSSSFSGGEKVYRPPPLRGQNPAMSIPAANSAVPVGKTRNAEYEAEHQLQQVLDGKLSSRASQPPPSHGASNAAEPASEKITTATRDSEGKKTETIAAATSSSTTTTTPRQRQTTTKPAGGEVEKEVKELTTTHVTSVGGDAAASSKLISNNIVKDGRIQSGSSEGTSSVKKSSSSLLNPNAKEFKLNPSAKTFMPGHTGGGVGRSPPGTRVRAPVTGGVMTAPHMAMPVSGMTMVVPQGVYYPGQQPVLYSPGGQQMQVPVMNMGQMPYDMGGQVPLVQGYGCPTMGYAPQGGVPMQGGIGQGSSAAALAMHPEGSVVLPTGAAAFHPPSPMQHATPDGSPMVYSSPRQTIVRDNNGKHHTQHVGEGGPQSSQG